MELKTTWEKRAEEKGEQKGEQKGELKAKREFICKFLRAQYGEDSQDMQEKVQRVDDLDMLETLSDRLFAASDRNEMQKIVDDIVGK